MDKNLKHNYLEKINKLTFETETQEFIKYKDLKDFKKLFIIKFINIIKKSNLKILENLEKLLNEEFKVLMINLIDNFKKLDIFFDIETNNNPEFRKTVYYDFTQYIFFYKIVNKHNKATFY